MALSQLLCATNFYHYTNYSFKWPTIEVTNCQYTHFYLCAIKCVIIFSGKKLKEHNLLCYLHAIIFKIMSS